jgi:salicylate hydroxylase
MLPMMAQGDAQSIEDGAALAALLEAMPNDIAGALACYACHKAAEGECRQRIRFHLADGETQHARDAALATSGDRSIANIAWLYAHDAAEAPNSGT